MTMATPRTRCRSQPLPLRLVVLSVLLFAVVVNGDAAVSENDNEQTCTLDTDGSCLDPSTRVLDDSDANGIIDTGYGEAQKVEGEHSESTRQVIREMLDYMERSVLSNHTLPQHVKDGCSNKHELCAFWSAIGECEANPSYMQLQCAPSCRTCHRLSFEERCPMPENVDELNAWKPGDLNAMFERISADPKLDVNIIMKPGMYNEKLKADSPWVITIDNFLTPEQCETMIELGAAQGYERSKDVGAVQFDGTYGSAEGNGRTSTNAWCLDDCYDHSTTKEIIQLIETLTGIPDTNSEYLQLLRYEEGQFYEIHHDYIRHHIDRAQGPRILTVFFYLNDVEQGGGTNFPDLDVTVEPKQGRVLIWPSVKDHQPDRKDHRTDHQALAVEKGIKYAANGWLHLRDFKTPYSQSCI